MNCSSVVLPVWIFSKLPLDCYLYNLHFQNVFSCVVFPRAIIFFFFMKMVLNQAISIKNHKESLFELTPNNWRKLRIYSNTNLFFHKMVFLFHSTSAAPFSLCCIHNFQLVLARGVNDTLLRSL